MRSIFVALLVLLGACAWSLPEAMIQTGTSATLVGDWVQTRTSVAPHCAEINPILGKCPPSLAVDAYFLVVSSLQLMVANALPSPWRAAWSAMILGIEADTIFHNVINGYGGFTAP